MNIKHGADAVLAMAAASTALVFAGAAGAAPASPAPGTPLVSAKDTGWQGLAYRPGAIYVGNGGSPFVSKLSWSSPGTWTTSSATTRTGDITQYWPQPGVPSYQWPSTTRAASVYLHDPLTHSGQPYFAKMRWNWTNAHGVAKVAYWLTSGGFWQPR